MAKKGGKGKRGSKRRSKTKKPSITPQEVAPVEEKPPPEPEKPKPPPLLQPLDSCPDKNPNDVVMAQPNHYPSLLRIPETMAVVGSENGCYDSIMKLLRAGFRCAERVLVMAPWGNYVVFRYHNNTDFIYFLFDGCTCDVNRFRYLDLSCGTAGFLYFEQLPDIVAYIIQSRKMRLYLDNLNKIAIDQIVEEYGTATYTQKSKCMKFS